MDTKLVFYLAEETESFGIYKKTEWRCRAWTKRTLILNTGALAVILILPALIHSLGCMWHGNFDTSTWYTFLKLAVPFDTSNIFVWYGLLIPFAIMGTTNGLIFGTILTYFVICSFYIDACCQHFCFEYRKFEEKIDENSSKIYENIGEIKKKMGDAVSLHVKIMELVSSTKNLKFKLFKLPIFLFLLQSG